MSEPDEDRTASLMTPAKLAQLQVRPRPAASPAAWLDALASDAGSGHLRRLADLRAQLDAQLRERDPAPVAAALEALSSALQGLDFGAVQPRGWLARALGRGKQAAVAFAAGVDQAVGCGEDLAAAVRSLHKRQQAASAERTVVEIEVEVRAIEKIMDQGARWLQDMRNQLKTRQAQGGDAAAQRQIAEDTQRCELLVVRLKQLRAVSGGVQQVLERWRTVAPQRAAFGPSLQALQDGPWKAWHKRAAPIADDARAGGSAGGVDRARQAQESLQAALRQAAQDCAALQAAEGELADTLETLQEPLRAAA